MVGNPLGLLERRARLRALAGRLCPLCRRRARLRPLAFDGHALHCLAGHGWSNPDAAEAEILDTRPQSLESIRQARAEQSELCRLAREADAEECRALLLRLERAVAGWMPPEAREC